MANTWPKERRLIGTKIQRLDGPEKATGHAKYSYDISRPGLLHGKILRSPYAHARLTSVDGSAAPNQGTTGKPDEAFKSADAVIEGTYGVPVISHQCLESHGEVAEWDAAGNLTVWASTQATTGVARELAGHFKIPSTKVKCITH